MGKDFNFRPSNLGITGKIVVYNPVNQELKVMQTTETFSGSIPDKKYVYYILAPLTRRGIVFLGDENKIAARGKKR